MLKRLPRACQLVNFGYVICDRGYACHACELADRIRADALIEHANLPLFGWRDALPQTPSYNAHLWLNRPVILSSEVMTRLGLPEQLAYQVIVADGGPGILKCNPFDELDGYLLVDRTRRITVGRHECYGVPTRRACEYYDRYFALGLRALAGYPATERRDAR